MGIQSKISFFKSAGSGFLGVQMRGCGYVFSGAKGIGVFLRV